MDPNSPRRDLQRIFQSLGLFHHIKGHHDTLHSYKVYKFKILPIGNGACRPSVPWDNGTSDLWGGIRTHGLGSVLTDDDSF